MFGQVLFYLIGHQLEVLKYWQMPSPKLGLYMQDGTVRIVKCLLALRTFLLFASQLQTVIAQLEINRVGTK